jgi:RNA methyltransferase, TrmH family
VERAFVLEGPTLLREALDAGVPVEAVYVAPATGAGSEAPEVAQAWERGIRVHDLAPGVLERIAGTVSPQPLLAVVRMIDVDLDALGAPGADPRPVIVCVDVRDPGNLGTVLRSAEAAGAAGVVCCDGTVDVYNPKCVRASAGALFHVPVVTGGDAVKVVEAIRARGRRCLGAAAGEGTAYTDVDLAGSVALVLGNEANGLPAGLGGHLDGLVHIPMEGRSESINVGMACAVLCFEAARQRRAGAGQPNVAITA